MTSVNTFSAGKFDADGFISSRLLVEHANSKSPVRIARVSFDAQHVEARAYHVEHARRDIAKGLRGGKRYAIADIEQIQTRVPDGFSADGLGAAGEVLMRDVLGEHVDEWSALISEVADKRPDCLIDALRFDIKTAGYSRMKASVRADRVSLEHYDALILVKLLSPGLADIFVVANAAESKAWEYREAAGKSKGYSGDTDFFLIAFPPELHDEYRAACQH